MKRAATLLLFAAALFAAQLSAAPEKWPEAYHRGVAAVNAKNYRDAAAALQRAIAEMPNEGTGVRAGKELITYVPHFWLGIAKFNLGDAEGALREWRVCEEQGVVARTDYYTGMKNWIARAEAEKQRIAQVAANAPRKAADAALSRALEMQLGALRAGGDRTESYLQAQRKLQDARGQFQKAGSDVSAYKATETLAQQAIALFASAADEGRRLKAARPAVVPQQPKKSVSPPAPAVEVPKPVPAPIVVPMETAPPDVESEAKVSARLAVQQFRRHAISAPPGAARLELRAAELLRNRLERARNDADYQRIASEAGDRDAALTAKLAKGNAPVTQTNVTQAAVLPVAPPPVSPAVARPDLAPAYRAFAAGDLAGAERLLTQLVESRQSAEAFLLRGCARYTRAMLSRAPESQLAAAAADVRAALQRDAKLRLDRAAFSPKLVAWFEQVRNGG